MEIIQTLLNGDCMYLALCQIVSNAIGRRTSVQELRDVTARRLEPFQFEMIRMSPEAFGEIALCDTIGSMRARIRMHGVWGTEQTADAVAKHYNVKLAVVSAQDLRPLSWHNEDSLDAARDGRYGVLLYQGQMHYCSVMLRGTFFLTREEVEGLHRQ